MACRKPCPNGSGPTESPISRSSSMATIGNGICERVIRVHETTAATERERKVNQYVYSLDFNEKCPNVDYLVSFLQELKSRSPQAYSRIQYIEQPTARDLDANPQNDVHAASKLIPVVIDESLTGKEAFLTALDMGYSGAALKACKGLSQSLLMAALGQKRKVFLCVCRT